MTVTKNTDTIIILSNTKNDENAKLIAKTLVNNKLAACVNIVPKITSVYRWKNEVVEDCEFLLIIKTTNKLFDDVKNEIIKLHNYELPEVISFNIDNGFDKYLNWIKDETKERK